MRTTQALPHNALLHPPRGSAEGVRYGSEHYPQRSEDTNLLLWQILEQYQREGVAVSYTMADFRHDFVKEHLNLLSLQERLEGLSAKERRQLLEAFSPKERRQVLEGLSLEELESYVKQRREAAASPPQNKNGNRKGRGSHKP
jgi:hypothetical protein